MSLPTDAKARKDIPLYRGLFCYFPDALCAVAELSRIGNEQHNPGQPIHWAKEKSTDEEDCVLRHMMDKASGKPLDADGVRHATKVAWRALAALQREIEAEQTALADWRSGKLMALDRPEIPPDADIRPGSVIASTATIKCGVCGYTAPIDKLQHICDPRTDLPQGRVETHIPAREDREPQPRCNLFLYSDTAGNHHCSKTVGHGGACSR